MGKLYLTKRDRRKIRVRSKINGTKNRSRLSVFRSSRFIYAQLIDDSKNHTIVSAAEKELPAIERKKGKIEKAKLVGKLLAQKAIKRKIVSAIFDRNGYLYHGRVKALAQGAREGGLKF